MKKENNLELKDKVALITGSSRGLGRAIALGLAGEGANIVIDYNKSKEAAEQVKREIDEMGRKTLMLKADVSIKDEVDMMVGTTLDTFGKIDILVNNAGILPKTLVVDMSEETWNRTINTNLKGVFLCSKAVIQPMMEKKSGKIINMTSGRGVVGQAYGAHYAATKGGIIAFTKSLALELASYGINVNAVAPGATDTDMWRGPKSKEEIEQKLKVPRLPNGIGMPIDIIGTVIYLATEASKYVTGQVIFLKSP
jgi:3-oxoacyl-[acyl-carrier protein] reductase